MVACEEASWIPPLQADQETIRNRLERGHIYLGKVEGALQGMSSFLQVSVDEKSLLEEPERFFDDFHSFYSRDFDEDGNAIFLYNVGVAREHRRQGIGSLLVGAVQQWAEESNADHLILDGRCPSYNGSKAYSQESFERKTVFRKALQSHDPGDPLPAEDVLREDPVIDFYFSNLPCEPLAILPDFLPADPATDGYRVMLITDC
ncbi:MAG: GNAT family N-acetyltransferase, partial [Candidatus Nanohaloarchaea archaeon]|nr:GNAT family N-acetyltransferase [Candidatus Nanohaloarchaea archaeon]